MASRQDLRDRRVDDLIAGFDRYVEAFDRDVPFTRSGQWEHHSETIRLRRVAGSIESALQDTAFIASLWLTLRAWGIGVRRSRLVDQEMLAEELLAWRRELSELDGLHLAEATVDSQEKVWTLIQGINIIDNKARLVALTKTLHHLLPDLVVPIDRAYTGAFFGWHVAEFQSTQKKIFDTSAEAFHRIAHEVNPKSCGHGDRETE